MEIDGVSYHPFVRCYDFEMVECMKRKTIKIDFEDDEISEKFTAWLIEGGSYDPRFKEAKISMKDEKGNEILKESS